MLTRIIKYRILKSFLPGLFVVKIIYDSHIIIYTSCVISHPKDKMAFTRINFQINEQPNIEIGKCSF